MAGVETEKGLETNPYLIDFLTLKEGEYILINRIKIARQNEEPSFGLEVTKIKPKDHNFQYMIVDQVLLDNAKDWILAQPQAENLTQDELKKLYGISSNLVKMDIEINK